MTAEPSWLSFTVGSSIRNCLRLLRLPLRALTLGEVHSRARGTDTNLKKKQKKRTVYLKLGLLSGMFTFTLTFNKSTLRFMWHTLLIPSEIYISCLDSLWRDFNRVWGESEMLIHAVWSLSAWNISMKCIQTCHFKVNYRVVQRDTWHLQPHKPEHIGWFLLCSTVVFFLGHENSLSVPSHHIFTAWPTCC